MWYPGSHVENVNLSSLSKSLMYWLRFYSRRASPIFHRCIKKAHEQKRYLCEDMHVDFHERDGSSPDSNTSVLLLWWHLDVEQWDEQMSVFIWNSLFQNEFCLVYKLSVFSKTRIYTKVKIHINYVRWNFHIENILFHTSKLVSCFIDKPSSESLNIFATKMPLFSFVTDRAWSNNNYTDQIFH